MNNLINRYLRKKKIADVIQKLLKRINNLHIRLKFVKNLLESIQNIIQHRKIMNNKNLNKIERKKNKFNLERKLLRNELGRADQTERGTGARDPESMPTWR